MGGSACCAGARPIGQKTHAGAGRPGRGNDGKQNLESVERSNQHISHQSVGFEEEVEGTERAESQYLEEEWTLVLGLRAGGPEPVRQWSGLGCGHEVAQSHWLLEDVQSLLMGLHAVCTLAL